MFNHSPSSEHTISINELDDSYRVISVGKGFNASKPGVADPLPGISGESGHYLD